MTAPTFADIQSVALNARNKAKAVRKDWKNREPSDARDSAFAAAVKELDDVVASLRVWRLEDSPFRKDAERETGDCLGVKGGTCRDWGKFAEAALAYDAGLPYEEQAQRLGGQPNSYCLVQRLVCRVLNEPEEFQRRGRTCMKALEVDDMDAALATSADKVRAQVSLRTDKRWALADVALLLQLLAGRPTGSVEAAATTWDELDDMGRDRFVYQSTLETVKALKSRLDPFLDAASRDAWDDLVSRLTLT